MAGSAGRVSSRSQRIVLRRKRPSHSTQKPSGSWKIAYADYMTAMMAFFLVMWLLSLVPKEDLKTIADYFRMPLMEAVRGGGPSTDSRDNLIPEGNSSVMPEPASSIIPGGAFSIIPHPDSARGDALSPGDAQDISRLENLMAEMDGLIKSDPVLKEYEPQLLLDMTPDGLRVQIVDRQNRPMFDLGNASIRKDLSIVLRALAPVFNELPNKITLSGHTDSIQYASGEREYSNWELSADRANAARRELVAGGMDEPKIKQVLGLSSTVSLIKDQPDAAVNRRISIVVLNQRAERRIDEQARAGASVQALENGHDLTGPADSSGFSNLQRPQP